MSVILWVAILAALEEVIKAVIATVARGTKRAAISTLVFAAAEAAFFAQDVYWHYREFGVTPPSAEILTAVMLVGGKLFHVYTGIVYLLTTHMLWAIVCMTALHTAINLFIDLLPSFDLIGYTIGPWLISTVAGLLCLLYVIVERRLSAKTQLARGE